MKKFFRKFFSWSLLYKTIILFDSFYTYLKDYYYISDTLYSEEFKHVVKKYIFIDLDKDWIGRLYGVLNPNLDIEGNYNFNNTIIEIDGENTNNNEFVKHWVYKQMNLIDQLFKINRLYDYISIEFEHVGPRTHDNYLVVFDIVSRKYFAQTFKKWSLQALLYAAAIILILMFI